MADDPLLIFEPFPSEDLRHFIEDHVANYTMVMTRTPEYQPLGYFLRHPRGEWVGGGLRGRGLGARLLRAAETTAIDHHAWASTLETFNPEAKLFYERQGYQVFGTLEDYPRGFSKFFLRKTLRETPPAR